MKKILLPAFALVLTYVVNAQTVLEQPKIGMSTASNLNIEKIELSDSATVLWFHTKYTPGNWISIPKKTYILPVGSKDTLYILSSEGIPLNKQYTIPASGEHMVGLIMSQLRCYTCFITVLSTKMTQLRCWKMFLKYGALVKQ